MQDTATEQRSKARQQDQFLATWRIMLRARMTEERIAALYRAGQIVGGVYTGRGQEAFSAALTAHLSKGDIYSPLIRDAAGRIGFGEPILDALRTYLGSASGPMRGRDGNVHRGRPRESSPAMVSHLGAMISVVNGMLMARRYRGEIEGIVGAACIGEGGTSTGSFHEGLNQAAVEKLPLVLAIADNQFAYSTPNTRQYACAELVDRAVGYGVNGHTVDATDLGACLEVFEQAVKLARSGGGPQVVVGKLLRLSGHGEHDDASYIPDEMRRSPLGVDCVLAARKHVLDKGLMPLEEVETLEEEIKAEIEEAVATTIQEPGPDPWSTNWTAISTPALREGQPEDK